LNGSDCLANGNKKLILSPTFDERNVMRIIPVILILLAACNCAIAQDTAKINALHKELVSAKDDTTKANILNKLGWEYHNINTDSAMQYIKTALVVSEKAEAKKQIAVSKYYLGRLYYTISNDSAAMRNFDDVLAIDKELNNISDMALVHMFKGYTYSHINRMADMLNEFLISLKYAEQSGDKKRMSDALYSIGDYYLHNEENDSVAAIKSRQYFLQALVIDKELDLKSNIAADYQYLGLCYTHLKNYKEAESNLKLCLKMFKELNDNFHVATAYSYLGKLYSSRGDIDLSISNYRNSQSLLEELGAKLEAADNADNIAAEFLKKNDFVNAIKTAEHGLALAREVNAERQIFYLYTSIAKAWEGLKQFAKAYNYLDSAFVLKDSLNAKDQRDKLYDLQTKYETERKEKENQLLKTQNLAANAQLQTNRILLIAALACLLMLAILLYFLYRNRQQKIKNIQTLKLLNAQLEEQKEAIAHYNTLLELKALRAQMNPHFIFNCMSSIQECMLTGRLDEANIYLSKLSRLLRMVLVHSDDEHIYLDKELEVLKLYLELESVRLKGGFDYKIEVDEDIPAEELLVPALLLQPFAENAIWHGLLNKEGERRLEITINMEDEILRCIIKDNGIGRQQAALMSKRHKQHVSKGMQLTEKRLQIVKQQSKEERTSLHITDLLTESGQPAGTCVEIILPVITQ